jgi:hypothetical protein
MSDLQNDTAELIFRDMTGLREHPSVRPMTRSERAAAPRTRPFALGRFPLFARPDVIDVMLQLNETCAWDVDEAARRAPDLLRARFRGQQLQDVQRALDVLTHQDVIDAYLAVDHLLIERDVRIAEADDDGGTR